MQASQPWRKPASGQLKFAAATTYDVMDIVLCMYIPGICSYILPKSLTYVIQSCLYIVAIVC